MKRIEQAFIVHDSAVMIKADGITSWLYGFVIIHSPQKKVSISNMGGALHYKLIPQPISGKLMRVKLTGW